MIFLKIEINDRWEDYTLKTDRRSNAHLVSFDREERTYHCTCEDYRFRRDKLEFGGVAALDVANHCKHITEVRRLRSLLVDGGFLE